MLAAEVLTRGAGRETATKWGLTSFTKTSCKLCRPSTAYQRGWVTCSNRMIRMPVLPEVIGYLTAHYRNKVLGEKVDPDSVLDEHGQKPEFVDALKAELATIRAIKSPNLAQRDFAAHQRGRAIEEALAKLKDKGNAPR